MHVPPQKHHGIPSPARGVILTGLYTPGAGTAPVEASCSRVSLAPPLACKSPPYMIKHRVAFYNMYPIIFLNPPLRFHCTCSSATHTTARCGGPSAAGEGAHQELLALLLFGGAEHLIVLQVTLQGLQPGLQELLRGVRRRGQRILETPGAREGPAPRGGGRGGHSLATHRGTGHL